MKAFKYLFVLLIFPYIVSSQTNFSKVWISGGGYNFTTTFNGATVVNKMICSTKFRYFNQGASNICDSNGNLILCSDGYNVYDSNLNFIDNGDTLVPKLFYEDQDGFSSLCGGSYFLPFDYNKYYLVTPAMSDSHYTAYVTNATADSISKACYDQLLYHVIDMKANGGAGKVVKKAVEILSNVRTNRVCMTACKHANGKDWWVLKQATDTNLIYSFLFRQDTVEGPFIQGFAEPHFGKERGWATNYGQSCFNQEGNKYITGTNNWKSNFFMADFDRCTGQLSNPKVINVPLDSAGTNWEDNSLTGLAFSKNGRFIYVIKIGNIWQFDLNDPDSATAWYHVTFLDTTFAAFQAFTTAFLAPNDKIYIGNKDGLSKQMSAIDNPDVKGAGCNFCPRCLRFDFWGATAPPNMPNYDLGPLQPCWPVSSGEIDAVRSKMLVVYPNPASTSLTIELISHKNGVVPLEMYNMVGELVLKTEIQSQTNVQINISSLPKGVYVIRCGGASEKVVVE